MLHVGTYLFSRTVASQVSSARQSLTSVFGMGTGGPSALIIPTVNRLYWTGFNSPNWTRTSDTLINSQVLYRLSYGGIWNPAQIWCARFVWVFLFCSLVSALFALPTELWRNIDERLDETSNLCRSVGAYLFSRAVASQVSSARQSLTSVFGMGTGGPSALITPTRSIQPFDCTDIVSRTFDSAMHLQGFEPGTHWLRVSCSTNWAKGA